MTDLDRAGLDRMLPTPAGPPDWDDVLGRARTADRRRRMRVVVLAAVALVVVVATASAIGRQRDVVLAQGFVGLPPVDATTSAPESGELVVRWEGFSATLSSARGSTIARAWVFADGRIIWDRRAHGNPTAMRIPEFANEANSGYLEQRLTPEGVELVRSTVTGLFDRTRALLETFPADEDRFGRVGRFALFAPDFSGGGSMDVLDGDSVVRLHWRPADGGEGASNRTRFEGTIATPEQLSALRRIDAMLSDPASELPATTWAVREIRAYVPSHYAVCVSTAPPVDASDLLSLLPARAVELLRDASRTRSEGDLVEAREGGQTSVVGRSVTDCYRVETEVAHDVADALSGLDREPGWKLFVLGHRVVQAVNHLGPTRLWFEPYLPHGEIAFSRPFG